MRATPTADAVVCALGVLMVLVYAVAMFHHATLDPYSMWCDPRMTGCVVGQW